MEIYNIDIELDFEGHVGYLSSKRKNSVSIYMFMHIFRSQI